MDPTNEIAHDFRPRFCVYKDGRVERFRGHPFVPPSNDDPLVAVRSKDVVISPEVSARLYLPKTANADQKLPLIVYIHGGAFTMESAFSSLFHSHVNSLTAAANAVAVSVDYRLAPEHPIPACYDDAWSALSWVASHATQQGPEPWLNNFVDFNQIYLAGDSAGANIVHNIAIRLGIEGLRLDLNLAGLVLVHPFFGSDDFFELWMYICKETKGVKDSRLNPAADLGLLAKLGCSQVLIFVGERDELKEGGRTYFEALKKSEWDGIVEIDETEGEDHVFHLFKPDCDKAKVLIDQIAAFINRN